MSKKIIQLLMEEKGYYTKDYSRINDISKIEPSFSIARNAKFMTLEEVGQIYCQMDQELYEKLSYFPYDDYQLQQNFIKAIYYLMIERELISENQKLTNELKTEICNKYLHKDLIVKTEEKETSKQF